MTNEIVPVETDAAKPEGQPITPTLWRTDEPRAIVQRATELAETLADIIRRQKLYVSISGRNHVRVEGWTLLGTLLGVFPVCVWTRTLADAKGWEARVEARTLAGAVVGAAEASCSRDERLWKERDDFALRSMAQTRATAKALRIPLGFVIAMAGYEATPAEEMPAHAAAAAPARPPGAPSSPNLKADLAAADKGTAPTWSMEMMPGAWAKNETVWNDWTRDDELGAAVRKWGTKVLKDQHDKTPEAPAWDYPEVAGRCMVMARLYARMQSEAGARV
jgi:hypothetical protein